MGIKFSNPSPPALSLSPVVNQTYSNNPHGEDGVASQNHTSYNQAAPSRLNPSSTLLRDRISSRRDGVEIHAYSLNSIRVAIESSLDMDEEVAKVTLQCKNDIWNTKDLFSLVEAYFDNSHRTIGLCTAVEECHQCAATSRLIVQAAMQQFEEEERRQRVQRADEQVNYFSSTIQELANFQAVGDPFTDNFFLLFESVPAQQVALSQKLQLKRVELDKKINFSKTMRIGYNMIFLAIFMGFIACAIIATVTSAPKWVTILAVLASLPVGYMGKRVSSVWRRYENEVEGQKLVVGAMETGTRVAITDLISIRMVVDRFKTEMKAMLSAADTALIGGVEGNGLASAMEEINKNLNGFCTNDEALIQHSGNCNRHVRSGRRAVLHKIIRRPSINVTF